MTAELKSVGDARLVARNLLAKFVESPQLEADIIVAKTLDIERESLTGVSEVVLNQDQRYSFEQLLKRRLDGEPIAYITGVKQFWDIDFLVTPDTLVPRPETELVIERALTHAGALKGLDATEAAVLDLGTGCGTIAVTLAREIGDYVRIDAVDRSLAALEIAKRNSSRWLNEQTVHFIESNWYEALRGRRYAMIVSNPPYIGMHDPCLADRFMHHEPTLALVAGEDGLEAVREIVSGSVKHLRSGGWLIIEHGSLDGDRVRALMEGGGLSEVQTFQDLAGLDRVTEGVFGKSKKSL